MLNNISTFLQNEEYRISFIPNKVHVMNYKRIIDINSNEVKINFSNKKVSIQGKDLKLVKLDKTEALISGLIEGLKLYE